MRDIRVFLFFVCLLFKIPLFILEGEREIEHGGEVREDLKPTLH